MKNRLKFASAELMDEHPGLIEPVRADYLIPPHFNEAIVETIQNPISPPDTPETALIRSASKCFIDFVKVTFPMYKVDPFHEHVATNLDYVVEGEIQNLMLFAPPQHGKSELVSIRLPSYWLGRQRDLPVALVSYGARLAERNSRGARSVFDSFQYRQIFPHMQKDTQNWRMADWHVTNHRGYVLAAGVGGAITGHGFGLGIIDDPVENWAAAQSDRIRESHWQWWLGTFKTRIWEGGRIIFMMTRWHEDDLAARILKSEGRIEEGGKWTVLSYPALAEKPDKELGIGEDILGRKPGEALAPSRFSKAHLNELSKDLGSSVWLAEYQQRPSAPQGSFFKVGRINYVSSNIDPRIAIVNEDGIIERLAFGEGVSYVRSWDIAATQEEMFGIDPDYTTGALLALADTGQRLLTREVIYDLYVLDMVRERLHAEQIAALIKATAVLDGQNVPIVIEQEPGAAGKSLIAFYQSMLVGWSLEGDLPTGRKQIRANPLASMVNNGRVFMLKGKWNREFLLELAAFPFGAHDDQVDSCSQGFKGLTDASRRWSSPKFKSV